MADRCGFADSIRAEKRQVQSSRTQHPPRAAHPFPQPQGQWVAVARVHDLTQWPPCLCWAFEPIAQFACAPTEDLSEQLLRPLRFGAPQLLQARQIVRQVL